MSDISSVNKISGSFGTAAARAVDTRYQAAAQSDSVRQARIEQLKQQYQNDEYVVDSIELSAAIFADLLRQHS